MTEKAGVLIMQDPVPKEVISIQLKLYNIRHHVIKYLMKGTDNKWLEFPEETY